MRAARVVRLSIEMAQTAIDEEIREAVLVALIAIQRVHRERGELKDADYVSAYKRATGHNTPCKFHQMKPRVERKCWTS